MHIIIMLYKLICGLCVGLFFAVVFITKERFRALYLTARIRKSTPAEYLQAILVIIAMCGCPILHLITLGTLLFASDYIVDTAIEKLEDRIIEE